MGGASRKKYGSLLDKCCGGFRSEFHFEFFDFDGNSVFQRDRFQYHIEPLSFRKTLFVLPNEVTRDVQESMVRLTAVAHQEEGSPVVRVGVFLSEL